MKRVYLARHGQTEANVSLLFQGENDPLTEVGQRQAIRLAERAAGIDFEKMIVSDYLRTRQTAAPILDVKTVPVEYSPLFREEKPPSSWVDVKSEVGEEGKLFFQNMVTLASDDTWRVEDAENASDVYGRIQAAVSMLEEDPAENIFVVTHGTFLKQLVAYILFDCQGTVEQVVSFKKILKTTNTGVTMIYHDDKRWRVLSWNDHAHFAE